MNIGEGGKEEKKREGNKPRETLNDRDPTEARWREVCQGPARWIMGIKEGTVMSTGCFTYVLNH